MLFFSDGMFFVSGVCSLFLECLPRCGALPGGEWSSWEKECCVVGTGQPSAGEKAL